MLHIIKRMTFPILLVAAVLTMPSPLHAAQQQPQPQAQTEFVPLDQLPPQEQMPAAPLVIAAYAIAWLGIFVYLASIWRRLQKVDRELADVARRVTERSRA
jgi:CcmD family protein